MADRQSIATVTDVSLYPDVYVPLKTKMFGASPVNYILLKHKWLVHLL